MLDENELIKQLREEAKDVKSCFTTYSIQSIIFSAAVLAAMFGVIEKMPLVIFSCIPVIILLMIITRIGIYKYATANRLYGYELHLGRIKKFICHDDKKEILYRDITWEEAQRAWRVVQTRVFREIYVTPECNRSAIRLKKGFLSSWVNYIRPDLYRYSQETNKVISNFKTSERKKNEKDYPWFLLDLLTTTEINDILTDSYHAGTYLKNILGMLILMQYLLLSPLLMVYFNKSIEISPQIHFLIMPVFISMLLFIFLRYLRVERRRKMLEKEFLSIHSCSIIWQAIVLTHHLALKKCHNSYKYYTLHLVDVANDLANNIYHIHDWIIDKTNEWNK